MKRGTAVCGAVAARSCDLFPGSMRHDNQRRTGTGYPADHIDDHHHTMDHDSRRAADHGVRIGKDLCRTLHHHENTGANRAVPVVRRLEQAAAGHLVDVELRPCGRHGRAHAEQLSAGLRDRNWRGLPGVGLARHTRQTRCGAVWTRAVFTYLNAHRRALMSRTTTARRPSRSRRTRPRWWAADLTQGQPNGGGGAIDVAGGQ
jgi:hypothetical protein